MARQHWAGLVVAAALLAGRAEAAAPAPAPDYTPVVIAAGAIAGVVVFNVLALGWQAVPAAVTYASGATVPAEMSVAISRVYAVSSAAAGALAARYLYAR